MNGKNRRTKSCWSRGAPTFSRNKPQAATNEPLPPPPKPVYTPPVFPLSLYANLDTQQAALANYFSRYPYVNTVERFSYNNNTPYAIVDLKNEDFINGTVRIKTPGVYRLVENITFNPNPNDDFLPRADQDGPNGLYPQRMMGPYHLGFFAAITVECDDVIIDLNSFTLQQSEKHNFQQRFYANIELANAPFITNTGPANFQGAMQFKAANRVLVYNGHLKLSSHHGIHANTANNVMLYNLLIDDFEVAGVALNGTKVGVLSKLYIQNNKTDIKVLSTYSQSRFIRSFLKLVLENDSNAYLTVQGQELSIAEIKNKLDSDLTETFNAVFPPTGGTASEIPVDYFKNTNIGYDGNVYGLVLNVNGPAVGPFLTKEKYDTLPDPGNMNIHLENIIISNISSHPIEIIGIKNPAGESGAYGKKMQGGPIGDIFELISKFVNSNGKYTGTTLSNSQLIIAKSTIPNKGTTSITTSGEINTLKWAEEQQELSVLTSECYLVGGGDSMGHTMKGNLGLFISGGKNITGTGIYINGIKNNGQDVGKALSTIAPYLANIPIQPEPPISGGARNKLGSSAVNILLTACDGVVFTNTKDNLQQPISQNIGDGTLNNSVEPMDSTNLSIR